MTISLLPRRMLGKLTDITPALLQEWGVQALLMDFDNTIVPYTTDVPTEEVAQWFREMRQSEIFLCVVSNSRKPRVAQFCQSREIPCVTHSMKPFSKGIREALHRYGLDPKSTALVGDQIYTDVLGANSAGLQSILVRPIHLHNVWLRLRNVLELPLIAMARRLGRGQYREKNA